ncbi:MAG TPA: hypothetical protein VM011_04815 [Gammaproteobacteria bacterium]|nr:hypothetical protein [Gammaproteobacteria bacterium]
MVIALLPFLISCDSFSERLHPEQTASHPRDAGYRALRTLLSDEQHIKTLRIVKSVVTFQATSDSTIALIDDIATTASSSLAEIDKLATLEPEINFDESAPAQLGSEILDALRVATAWELISASRDDFELNLVLSQTQALRLISQLLKELQKLDPNAKRQVWLAGLDDNYVDLYRRAVARLSVADE